MASHYQPFGADFFPHKRLWGLGLRGCSGEACTQKESRKTNACPQLHKTYIAITIASFGYADLLGSTRTRSTTLRQAVCLFYFRGLGLYIELGGFGGSCNPVRIVLRTNFYQPAQSPDFVLFG